MGVAEEVEEELHEFQRKISTPVSELERQVSELQVSSADLKSQSKNGR